jgi:acetylornithine aminotransferase/acetylornithine/N-succinyldiaminopimelate aminotransferase
VRLDREMRPVVGALREAGVIVGTSGKANTLRLMPPLTTTDADVDDFLSRFAAVVGRGRRA